LRFIGEFENAKCKMQNQARLKPFAEAKAIFCGKSLTFYAQKVVVPYKKIFFVQSLLYRHAVL